MTPRFPALLASLLFAAGMTVRASAQPHDGDILLTIEDSRIVTNTAQQPERIFSSTMGIAFPDFTSDPGFDCEPGTFSVPSRIGFRVLDALRVWNGSDFDAVAGPQMEIAFSTLSTTTPSTPQTIEGFTLAVGSNGQWHRHLEYTLLSPGGTGVYLLTMELFSTAGGVFSSEPFWMVFNNGSDPNVAEQAMVWVRDRFLSPSCDPDVNCDGSADQGDVACIVLGVAGDGTCVCGDDADFNADGSADQGDVAALIQVVAGAPCP